MGKKESGDIDIVITYDSEKIEKEKINIKNIFYETMIKNKIIKDILVSGEEKSIYIIKTTSKSKYHRKMDVAFIDKRYVIWYLFYFGRGRDFSKKIRTKFARKGYKLTDKGLFDRKTGKRIDFEPTKEEDLEAGNLRFPCHPSSSGETQVFPKTLFL